MWTMSGCGGAGGCVYILDDGQIYWWRMDMVYVDLLPNIIGCCKVPTS